MTPELGTVFIIEHPSRGAYCDVDIDGKPHFRWSIPRDHEDIVRYYCLEDAQRVCDKINTQLRGCYVVRFPDRHARLNGAKIIKYWRDKHNEWVGKASV